MITSAQNKFIKEVKALSKKKDRVKTGLFVAEGFRFVKSAIELNAEIMYVLYSDSIYRTDEGTEFINTLAKQSEIRVLEIEEKLMKELSDTQSHQGVLAVIKQPRFDWDDVVKKNGFILILDRLQDPGNLGTIVRTADAAGADGVITIKGTVDVYNPKVLRSTMGSVFEMPVLEGLEWEDVETKLKEAGYHLYATALENSVEYDAPNYLTGTAMIIGNEANGISSEILEASDTKVKIPIIGSAESLNAGVAAAVVMYEVLRQRRQ